MAPDASRYIPALSFHWLTPLYDPLLRWGMREADFKRRLISRAHVRPGQDVLDLLAHQGDLPHRTLRRRGLPSQRAVLRGHHRQ